MELLKIILLLIANALTSNVLAFWFTDKTDFKVKPLNCYGCLSFWLSLGLGGLIAFKVASGDLRYLILFTSLVIGLANYFYVKSKYQIYE